MKAYPEYKESNVEWLGNVPEGWNVKRVKWLCSVKRGQSPRPIDDASYFDDNGEYAWVRISDVTASEKYLYQTEQKLSELGSSKSVKLEPNELFVSIAATVGKPIINKIKCCIHDGFVWLEGLEESKEFMYFVFSGGELYKGLGKLGTQLNLNSEYIANIYVPVPPRDEQKIIVKYLENKTAQIDTLIEKKQRQIDLLQEQRTALINHAVTKGLNPNVKMKDSGVEWLGEIPSHWEVVKIKNMAKIMRGQFSHRPRNDPAYYDGAYPFVQTGDVTSADKYITTYQQTLNELGYSVSKEFPKDTIVMTIAANIGDVAILDFKSCFPDSMVGIVPFDNMSANYMYYNMKALKQEFIKISSINTQLNINVDKIENQISVKPPIREQEEIANHLDDMLKKTKLISEQITSQINLLQEYRTALISEAVTGKVDVR